MHLTERPSGDFPNRWIEKMKSMIEDPRWEQASELGGRKGDVAN